MISRSGWFTRARYSATDSLPPLHLHHSNTLILYKQPSLNVFLTIIGHSIITSSDILEHPVKRCNMLFFAHMLFLILHYLEIKGKQSSTFSILFKRT